MNPDFLIAGGGVIGLASAFRLARDGAAVTVIERGAIGAEASWAGAGILSPLLPWQYADVVNDLCRLSLAVYPEWVAAVQAASGVDAEYRRSGMRVLPPFDVETAQRWCDRYQWPWQMQSMADASSASSQALWLPEVAQIRNPRLIQSLRAAVAALGVQLLEHTEITEIVSHDGRVVSGLRTTGGDKVAGAYIVCTGAWSQGVLTHYPPAKIIKPIRGQMLLFKSDPNALRPIIYQDGLYIVPRADGHILVGSTLEEAGFDKSTTPEAEILLKERAYAILPALTEARFLRHWSGLRPGSPDNIPSIARHPSLSNLYINAGHFRYGVTMAPASADLIAELILSKKPTLEMTPYRWND